MQKISSRELHGDAKTVLESPEIFAFDGSTRGEVDLRINLLDQACARNSIAANLRLDDAHVRKTTVRAANGKEVNLLRGGVGSARRKAEVGVVLVQKSHVEFGELRCRSDASEEGSAGITRAKVVRGRSGFVTGDVVG